jgi:hypothetical protein
VTENINKVHQEGEMASEQEEKSQESHEPEQNQLNSFWNISFGEEQEEVEEVHMSQNIVTTRSTNKKNYNDGTTTNNPTTPTTYTTKPSSPPTNFVPNPLKNTPSNQKMTNQTLNLNTISTPPVMIEYDLLEYLKNTKEKISLFELMKIPQIQENVFKTL